jgi:hypothetical protein
MLFVTFSSCRGWTVAPILADVSVGIAAVAGLASEDLNGRPRHHPSFGGSAERALAYRAGTHATAGALST